MIQTSANLSSATPEKEVEITVEGQAVAITQWLAGLAKSSPSWFSSNTDPKAETTPAGETMTARGVRLNAAANRSELLRQEAEALAEKHGNPYVTGNFTHKLFIEKNDPALAAKLRARAGVRK